jgi:D-alanyl-lipoteichoic acid acyltransferase DltB (MBOAT superfamily)
MIQRIQSVYLLLAALAVGATAFLPLASTTVEASASVANNYFADGAYWANESVGYYVLFAEVAFILLAIFLYKNRPTQIKQTTASMVVALVLMLVFVGLGYKEYSELQSAGAPQVQLGSMTLPLAIVFLILASRAIRKDEALVRSSDRLR